MRVHRTHPTSLFYTDPQCQATFRRATGALLARVNRRTGLPYAADPTIMGWELANEPRCEGPGGADMVRVRAEIRVQHRRHDTSPLSTHPASGRGGGVRVAHHGELGSCSCTDG